MRLIVERQLRLGEWRCERALAQSAPSRSDERPHLPDGLLTNGGREIAVEVELTLKSRARLEAILGELGHRYDEVWYFAAPSLRRAVSAVAGEAPWQNISVYSYPPWPAELPR